MRIPWAAVGWHGGMLMIKVGRATLFIWPRFWSITREFGLRLRRPLHFGFIERATELPALKPLDLDG